MCDGLSGYDRRSGGNGRRFVNRTRAGLRHDHARSRGNGWPRRLSRDWRPRGNSLRGRLRGRRRGYGNWRCRRSDRRWRGDGRDWRCGRTGNRRGWPRSHRRHDHSGRRSWSRTRSSCNRRRRPRNRRGNRRFNFRRRRSCCFRRSYRRCGAALLLANDRLQNVPGTGDVREVDFCLNAFGFGAGRARGFSSCAFAGATQFDADFLRLILFQRTGVRLLLGHPYVG
jgi:hypothetical protein